MNPISPAGISLLQTYSRQRSVRQRQDRPHLDELRLLLFLVVLVADPYEEHGPALFSRMRGALRSEVGTVCVERTPSRRVDSLTATSRASRRCGLMKTPSTHLGVRKRSEADAESAPSVYHHPAIAPRNQSP